MAAYSSTLAWKIPSSSVPKEESRCPILTHGFSLHPMPWSLGSHWPQKGRDSMEPSSSGFVWQIPMAELPVLGLKFPTQRLSANCQLMDHSILRESVLLPGKSHGWRRLVGCSPWGCWVGYDWMASLSLFTFMHWRRKWQLTPVFLPGESQGQGSLVGCRLWGRTESDTTEAA